MAYISPFRFGITSHMQGTPLDDRHADWNFRICRAVDSTSIGCVLNEMVAAGVLPREQADLFQTSVDVLRALICTENNRILRDARAAHYADDPDPTVIAGMQAEANEIMGQDGWEIIDGS